jgi:hypothetical protein
MAITLAPALARAQDFLPDLSNNEEVVREQEAIIERSIREEKKRYYDCLADNKKIYQENKAKPLCALFGKCAPTTTCHKPAF